MKTTSIFAWCMVAVFVSFLGFIVENCWLALTKGYMDNRNMCLPFLLGYGLAIVVLYLLFGTPEAMCICGWKVPIRNKKIKVFLYYVCMIVCVSVGEILLGTFVEKVCHFSWWDYSSLPLHITKYTSVPTSMMFAFLITFFMDRFMMPLYGYFRSWDYSVLSTAAPVLSVLMSADFVYNAYKMYQTQGMVRRWKVHVKGLRDGKARRLLF